MTGTSRVVDEVPDYDFSRHPEPYYCTWEKGRVLPEYAVLYITRGTGEFESETTGTKTITAGNAFLLFSGVWHRYRPLKESPWTEYWVTFGGGYPQRLLQRKFMSPKNPVLATGLDETILGVYRRLWDHVQSAEIDIQQMIAANIMEILASVFRAARVHQNRDQARALVRQAELILQQSIEQSVDMQELAASLGVSYHYFRRVFKRHTGVAPYQYHLQLRINRAKDLLAETSLSVKQGATALRFTDPYHFSNIFKKRTGVSPTRWQGSGYEEDSSLYP
ncbi:MAG: AraC family transcriptional regulator [Pirellulaceae bacterium]